jgi:hypothetical protein
VPITLKRIDAELPKDSRYYFGPCEGSTFLQNKVNSNSISFEFDRIPANTNSCETRLRAITIEITLSSSDAEFLRVRLIDAVAAAGGIAPDLSEYQWRSDDSRVRYVLTTSVAKQHGGKETLWAKLRHIPASPETVDGLPFHKGYFPPQCAAQKK